MPDVIFKMVGLIKVNNNSAMKKMRREFKERPKVIES